MRLAGFTVSGFRSLGQPGHEIPVRKPTILTGANAGGKTSALVALGFLLEGRPEPRLDDRTYIHPAEEVQEQVTEDGTRYSTTTVTGRFELSSDEQQELNLPADLLLRRFSTEGEVPRLEMLTVVPQDEDLRGLEVLGLDQLRERAEGRALEPVGRRNAKESWRTPLQELVDEACAGGETVEEWVSPPRTVIDRLPRFLLFSSTEEPEPEREIQLALREAFGRLLDDPTRLGPVRRVEQELRSELATGAEDLRQLIVKRCPEVGEVVIEPEVSFREGLANVLVYRITDDGRKVGLRQSGAGRRRQVNLAIWEWTRRLLDAETEPADIVIAYDEPDTHLDYHHQRELMELIRDQSSSKGVSMVVATHSLNLIDKVSIEHIVHLQLDNHERTLVERLLEPEHEEAGHYLARLSTAMGLRNSVLLHERFFLGVEGPTEAQVLPVLFQVATGSLLQSAGIALISGRSNIGALDVAKYLHETGRKVAFVVDRDSLSATGPKRVFAPKRLKAAGFSDEQINFVGKAELEDLFTDEQWAATANRSWRRDDGGSWTPEHVGSLRSSGKFSSRLLEMVRTNCSDGPDSKPELLLALAIGLEHSSEVPLALRQLFDRLVRLAA